MCLHIAGRCDVISAMTSHIVVAPNSINRARLAELRQTGRAKSESEREEKKSCIERVLSSERIVLLSW